MHIVFTSKMSMAAAGAVATGTIQYFSWLYLWYIMLINLHFVILFGSSNVGTHLYHAHVYTSCPRVYKQTDLPECITWMCIDGACWVYVLCIKQACYWLRHLFMAIHYQMTLWDPYYATQPVYSSINVDDEVSRGTRLLTNA